MWINAVCQLFSADSLFGPEEIQVHFILAILHGSKQYLFATSEVDPEGVQGVRSNPPLRQNYSIFMEHFQKKSGKLTNNQLQPTNRTPFVSLNPLSRNPGSAPKP